jgi:diguanylate cyclase (GGDEF)-like protein
MKLWKLQYNEIMKMDAMIDTDIEEEFYKGVSSNTMASSIALFLNILVIDIAFYEYISLYLLSLWTLSISSLLILRNIDARKYINKTTNKTIQELALRFKALSLAIAVLVSFGIIYITPVNLPFHQAFLAMIVAGLSAGAVMALSYYQNLLRLYLFVLILPFATLMMLQGGKIHILISFLMFLFLVMLAMFSKRFFKNLLALIISKNETYFQAHYDHITGLINRTTLYDRLSVEILKLKRSKRYSALLFIDLDNFKNINDSFGHHIGDELLKLFAKKISATIREEDTFARLGGDEFVILLSHLSDTDLKTIAIAQHLAEKIHTNLKEPLHIEEKELFISVSIGIDIIYPENATMLTIIKNADAAMYQAKKSGKNKTIVFKRVIEK